MELKMSRKIRKLTPAVLRKIVMQESLSGELEPIEKVDAEEVDAGELAGSLEKDIDHAKVLKLEESRLRNRLRRVQSARKKIAKRILKGL